MVRRHGCGPLRSAGWTRAAVLLPVVGAIVLAGSPVETSSTRVGPGQEPGQQPRSLYSHLRSGWSLLLLFPHCDWNGNPVPPASLYLRPVG